MARKKKRKSRLGSAIGFTFLFSIFIGAFGGALAGYLGSAPTLAEVNYNPELTSYIYDRNGTVLARLYKENRDQVSLKQIPKYMQQAVVAIEDPHFYSHHGVDLRGLARAILVNIKNRSYKQGGSTITQQLAKNAFLTNDRTLARKMRELLWTIQLERRYTKDEILEAYLNEVLFGHGAYGVEAAAQLYFGKHIGDVTLSEAAFLAGVTNGPSIFSPFINKESAIRRRNLVLTRMEEQGYITAAEARAAKNEPLVTVDREPNKHLAPYFVDYVLQTLLNLYGEQRVYAGGIRVYTSLDLSIQRAAEQALLNGLPRHYVDANGLAQPQGAIIAVDPGTGAIRAMVGGRGTDKFNRAVQAERQPGSAFKPVLYAAAIEAGYTPASMLKDEPISLALANGASWRPENSDRRYRGTITLREALELSVNTVAVKLAQEIGPRNVLEYGRRLGITTLVDKGEKNDVNAGIALGGLTRGVSPLELTAAYIPFANGGVYIKPVAITKIVDRDGTVLYEAKSERRAVMSEALATMMTDMMRGVVERGTGTKARIGRPAAGKTGTSSDYTNAWFVGYTPQLIATVWLGNDSQARPMTGPGGNVSSSKAAEIWATFMKQALAGEKTEQFSNTAPGLVTNVAIDTTNGLRVPAGCSLPSGSVRYEMFLEGHVPQNSSPRCN